MQRNNPLRWSKSLSDLHAKNINFWQNVLDFQVRLQRTADLVTCMTLASSDLEAPGSVMASVVFFLLILAAYASCSMQDGFCPYSSLCHSVQADFDFCF